MERNAPNYEEAVAYILQVPRFTEKNLPSHTKEFLKKLKNPEQGKKVIHVAGTNGKGSVCAYMQALLLAEQKKVGLFTSPHLVKINERIRMNGSMISDELFLDAFLEVMDGVKKMHEEGLPHPTFFEMLFGMAMISFDRAGMEYVILETGMGGRLDATNAVANPLVTILTSISLDHTEILGDTIEKIAAEKAGIIKEGVPVICDANEPQSIAVIRKTAQEKNAPCREITNHAYEIKKITEKDIAFSCTDAYYESVTWNVGSSALYQVNNAVLALSAMPYVMKNHVKHLECWKKAIALVRWEGRMEEVSPGIIVDGAHNLGAVQAFTESVHAMRRVHTGKTVVLFSAVKEKAYEKMIAYLCSHMKTDTYVITKIDNARGVDAKKLALVFHKYTDSRIVIEENVEKALEKAIQEKGTLGTLYCLGSLYLVGKIKELW
ncbi:MAG: folylpolyglutamate synthase/dihydrofolate synthase family protein [Lachnospiraceae bacterium]